jgi:hypothetical protein
MSLVKFKLRRRRLAIIPLANGDGVLDKGHYPAPVEERECPSLTLRPKRVAKSQERPVTD